MRTLPLSAEVVIVGAGPTGLALANLLGLYGVEALLLERQLEPCTEPRAISLDDEGARVCQALGLWQELSAQLLENSEVDYYSGQRLLSRVKPARHPNGFPLFSTFYQPAFERILRDGLKRFPNITVRLGMCVEKFRQEEEHVLVAVRDAEGELQQVRCSYLLACDGAKSSIRHALRIPMSGATYAQRWLVIDALDVSDSSTKIRFFCNPARPAVNVPAPGQRRRWEFMLLPGERAEELTRPVTMRALISQVSPEAQPQITRATVYTFHAALARTFQVGRVFLLGDAAHLMPPFGGQGMNCGLRDAHNLAWKLHLVLRGRAELALLTTYTRERREHARRLIRFSCLLGAVIMPTARPIAWLRDGIFALLNGLPPIRNALSQAAIKPQARYPRGWFWRGGSSARRRLVGCMLPQPLVCMPDGGSKPLDDLLGAGFALLCFSEIAEKEVCAQALWRQLDVRLLRVDEEEVRRALGVSEDLCVLVRPDRYIYAAFRSQEASHFTHACAKNLDNAR